jgi:multidrug efflux pump subunit AcrA (membrane-fusion protein)
MSGSVMGESGTGGTSMSASSGQALFLIEDMDSLEISVGIPEFDATLLSVGMYTEIATDAIDGKEWRGEVKSISPVALPDTNNFTVVISVDSPADGLTAGMSAKTNIVTSSKAGVFAVPYDAISENEAGQSVVFAWPGDGEIKTEGIDPENVSEGIRSQSEEIVVETGMESDYYIEIASDGLKAGMLILADPEGKNVVEESTAFGPPMSGGF